MYFAHAGEVHTSAPTFLGLEMNLMFWAIVAGVLLMVAGVTLFHILNKNTQPVKNHIDSNS
jgi:hypothetical protein